MTAVLDAPASPASESPAVAPTTGGGHSEAMIVACVLADLCGPQGIDHLTARDRVEAALARHAHAYFLAWRDRAELGHWSVKWDCARRAARALYPKLPGVADLPDVYQAQFGPAREMS